MAQFDCSGVDAVEPIIDRVEFSIRYNTGIELSRSDPEYESQLMERYAALCHMIARDAGPLQKLKKKRYCQQYGITLTEPGLHWGWGKIYLEPTTEALKALQGWLDEYFGPDLRPNVKLRLVELAWDFYAPGLDEAAYNAIALRLASRIVPLHAVNMFARAIVRSDRKKQCRDGARNGRTTCYIQATTRKNRHRSGWNLSRNKKSARHSKLYAKAVGRGRNKRWFLRVEMTLQGKRRQLMRYDDFASLMNITNGMRFSDFWRFKQIDVEKFISAFPQPEPGLRGIRNRATRAGLAEVAVQSSADKLRMLKATAATYNLSDSRVRGCVKEISFQEALNMPRPADFEIPESPNAKSFEETTGIICTKPLPRDVIEGKFRLQGFWNIQQSQPKLLGI